MGSREKGRERWAHVYIEDNINWELRARMPVAVRSHLLLPYSRQTKGIDLLYSGEKDGFGSGSAFERIKPMPLFSFVK